MNDPELFELCKEVYKRTGWEARQPGYYRDNEIVSTSSEGSFLKTATNRETLPLYTSDYLLEKLPKTIENTENGGSYYLELGVGNEPWEAAYCTGFDHYKYTCGADTPLKALLKLTIALHEAGDVS